MYDQISSIKHTTYYLSISEIQIPSKYYIILFIKGRRHFEARL